MQAPKSGQLIAFDNTTTYAIKVFTQRNCHSPMFFPATDGYLLYADANDNEPVLRGPDDPRRPLQWLPQSEYLGRNIIKLDAVAVDRDKGVGFTRVRPPKWAEWIPIRMRSMVITRDAVFVAGAPDVLDAADPLAALEGRRGARLRAVSKVDGSKRSELALDSPPVFDGLIPVDRRLYVSLEDGSIACFGR